MGSTFSVVNTAMRRIAYGNDAQLVVLPPVSRFFNSIREIPAENLTLREAVEAMTTHVPDVLYGLREQLDAMVWEVLELAQMTLQYGDGLGLNVHQAAALRLYTAGFLGETQLYSLVNNSLRTRHALPAFVSFIWLLLGALKKCPVFRGTHVYRGINVEGEELTTLLSKYRPNMRHHWYGFTSTTAIVSVQEQFLGESVIRDENRREHRLKKGVMFNIQLRPGARVISQYSNFPGEEEILLPPNFAFEVVSSSRPNPGLHIFQLRELEPDEVLMDMNSAQPNRSVFSPADPTYDTSIPIDIGYHPHQVNWPTIYSNDFTFDSESSNQQMASSTSIQSPQLPDNDSGVDSMGVRLFVTPSHIRKAYKNGQ